MRSIWKFQLNITDSQIVEMPQGSNILTCAMQDGILCVWAEVHTELTRVGRVFYIVGTGNELPFSAKSKRYVGSVDDSPFVWHVFCDF